MTSKLSGIFRKILFIGLQMSILISYASDIDSLKNRLAEVDIEDKIGIANELSLLYRTSSLDSALYYAHKSFKWALEWGDLITTTNSINKLGDVYFIRRENKKALSILNQAIQTLQGRNKKILGSLLQSRGNVYATIGEYKKALLDYQIVLEFQMEVYDTLGIADIHNNIGVIYYYLGEYQKSVESYQQSILLYEALHNKNNVAITLGNVAMIYNEMNDFIKAVEYSQKALEAYYELDDYLSQAYVLINLGNIYKNAKNYTKSIEYCDKAIRIAEGRGFLMLEALAYTNMGLAYEGMGNLENAMFYFIESLNINRELNQTVHIIQDLRFIGRVYKKQGHYKRALLSLDESELLASQISSIGELYEIYFEKSALFALQNNYKEAYQYHQLYTELKDSLFTKEKHRQINELQTKYETEKKERENMELTQENSLQKLKILKNRYYILGLSIATIIILLFSTILIRQNRIKSRQNALELEQKLFRSQMNPHFIFNSLSAIQNFIIMNKPIEAGSYLADFAKLMRLIIENSQEEYITMDQELDTMNCYFQMQQLRFEEGFHYHVEVAEDIETEDALIPPMLAQPFIENAIEHAFRGRKNNNNLYIRYLRENDNILVEVEDNGIGREKAGDLNKSKHKSFAIEITQSRLERIYRKSKSRMYFQIVDLKSDLGEAIGTKVSFRVPLMYT